MQNLISTKGDKMSNAVIINNCEVELEVVGDQTYTTSLSVSEVFNKQHKHILAKIAEIPADFREPNFRLTERKAKFGAVVRSEPYYEMTKDGFVLLAMGFTGEKAYKFKIEYINAFNRMADEIRGLKFEAYVNKIAELDAANKLKARNHASQINGYKSQISQHNALIVKLKSELAELKPNNGEPRYKTLKTLLEHARKERDFYKQKLQKTEKEKRDKELVTFRALQQTKEQLEHVYTAIGAVEAYVANDDRFFMENNEVLA